jgi:hypothetical protein
MFTFASALNFSDESQSISVDSITENSIVNISTMVCIDENDTGEGLSVGISAEESTPDICETHIVFQDGTDNVLSNSGTALSLSELNPECITEYLNFLDTSGNDCFIKLIWTSSAGESAQLLEFSITKPAPNETEAPQTTHQAEQQPVQEEKLVTTGLLINNDTVLAISIGFFILCLSIPLILHKKLYGGKNGTIFNWGTSKPISIFPKETRLYLGDILEKAFGSQVKEVQEKAPRGSFKIQEKNPLMEIEDDQKPAENNYLK